MTRTATRPREVLLPVATLVAVVVVWWGVVRVFGIPAYLLPSPVAVGARLVTSPGLYLRNALVTLEKVLVGGTLGIVGGGLLAVGVATVPWLRRTLSPYLVTARVLPKIAVAPVLLIYVGTGFSTAVVFVALIAFFPMVVSTTAGLRSVPPHASDLLESVDADPVRGFLTVRLPYAAPDVLAGVKQSLTLAVVGAVVAEWIVANQGLGFLVLLGSETVRPDVTLAAVTLLFVEGLLLYGAVVLVQRWLPWTEGRS